MCLAAFSWQVHPDYPLLISANRDEFFDRPTAPLHQWKSGIYAGKDIRGGGTWMGFHPDGKWALLTNYRDFTHPKKGQTSRGMLVLDFLENPISPENYLDQVAQNKQSYEGFNLLVSDGERLFYFSNYGGGPSKILPGIHGLSNGLINDSWPKTDLAKKQLKSLNPQNITSDSLLSILKSTETYPFDRLPQTGITAEMEALLSSQLIRMEPNYGTVSATSVLRNKDGLTQLIERSFDWEHENYRDISFRFQS